MTRSAYIIYKAVQSWTLKGPGAKMINGSSSSYDLLVDGNLRLRRCIPPPTVLEYANMLSVGPPLRTPFVCPTVAFKCMRCHPKSQRLSAESSFCSPKKFVRILYHMSY